MGQLIRDTVHCLKTWSPFFSEVERGVKTFEVRRDDRGFSVGDVLVLQEFDGVNKRYSGNQLCRSVVYKLDGDQFGIEAGYCVLGLGPLPPDTKVECEQRPTTAITPPEDRDCDTCVNDGECMVTMLRCKGYVRAAQ